MLPIHQHLVIRQVVTGGQTGSDWAGAVAAASLAIPVKVTMPRRFLQRDVSGKDCANTSEGLMERLCHDVAMLQSGSTMQSPQ